jgi:hypothetical protein
MRNKTYLLALLLLSALPAFAQKAKQDSTKLLCRLWIIDRKAMAEQMKGKEDEIRVKKELERIDVFLHFNENGMVKSNQSGGNIKEESWSFSADKKLVLIEEKAQLIVRELTTKKFVFSVEARPNVLFYMTAPKKGYKLRLAPDKEAGRSEPASMPAEKKVEEKKEE